MLTLAPRLDVMNRLGRAMADHTRSRILMSLMESPGYPARLADELKLTRANVSNHLACLRAAASSSLSRKVGRLVTRLPTSTSPRRSSS